MNMKKLIVLSILLSLSSCSSLNKSHPVASLDARVETPLKAHVVVDMTKKIKGQASCFKLFGVLELGCANKFVDGAFQTAGSGLFSFGGSDGLKSAAAYNALRSANVDVVVMPQYLVEKMDYFVFSNSKATVTGYAGTIKKIE